MILRSEIGHTRTWLYVAGILWARSVLFACLGAIAFFLFVAPQVDRKNCWRTEHFQIVYDVMKTLVIGAGPTGLTAALALVARGVSCRIVERRTEPSVLSRAVGIMPVTIDLLAPLAAAAPILAEAMPLRQISLTRAAKPLMRLDNRDSEYKDRVILGLPQNRTEEILRGVLAQSGVHVEYGLTVKHVSTDPEQVSAEFSDGSSETYDWAIAADGMKSKTREQLGIAYPGYDLVGEWSIADVDVAGEFNPELVMLDVQSADGVFTMVLPIERRRARLVSSTPDALAALVHRVDIENVRRAATFQISVRQAESYRKNRVLLAGDAAHCHSPLGGKGMNLGMADAVAAAHAITSGKVDAYSSERHRIGTDIIKVTEAARRVVTSDKLIAKMALTAATTAVSNLPFARRAFMKTLTEL